MNEIDLKGWNYIVYTLIINNFKYKTFSLGDIYAYEPYFATVYPSNFHIKDKLRQILQNLRDKHLLIFKEKGTYQLLPIKAAEHTAVDTGLELVYLLSNESIPGWVKIGRTNAIERRLKDLYNTSVPLPFKVEQTIPTNTLEESRTLEKSIHSIIDTLNPNLRKNTEAYRREFFKMTPEEGKNIFSLVSKIIGITMRQEIEMSTN